MLEKQHKAKGRRQKRNKDEPIPTDSSSEEDNEPAESHKNLDEGLNKDELIPSDSSSEEDNGSAERQKNFDEGLNLEGFEPQKKALSGSDDESSGDVEHKTSR